MEDFMVECETCGTELWYEDAHSDESGNYCEGCHGKWLDEQVKMFAYLMPQVRAMAAYGDLRNEPDFEWIDEHDPRL